MRVLTPFDWLVAFYDGRVEGHRFSEERNWVDEGAISLGICNYAIVDGDEALVYDTHVSVEHARYVREALEARGVRRFTVVLSHRHLDHVAGTEAFSGSEVIANERTATLLRRHREAIETGCFIGPPSITPLVLPTRTFAGRLALRVGRHELELLQANIHSDDATVLWLPHQRVLLAGDTLEDTVTYVDQPGQLDLHLADLGRLRELAPERIFPSHGDPDVIAAGGYAIGLITATERYLEMLGRCRLEPELRAVALRDAVRPALEEGWLTYHPAYEAVHRQNVEAVVHSSAPDAG
jgi:cyclase